MNLIEARDKLNELIAAGKGHYQLIDNTEGLSYLSHFQEGIISVSENLWGHKREEFTSLEDIDDYLDQQDTDLYAKEKLKNKAYDAIRLF